MVVNEWVCFSASERDWQVGWVPLSLSSARVSPVVGIA